MVERIVAIPDGVEVSVNEREVAVKGPKGQLTRDFNDPRYNKVVLFSKEGAVIKISSDSEKRKIKAFVGTINRHLNNMVVGVTDGYVYTMKIYYSHFPISVSVKDKEVHIKNFIGEKGARIAKIVGAASVNIGKDDITVSGIDIESVGQTTANIEQACRLSRRDRRIFQDGIFMSEKALQTGGKVR